MCRGLATLAAVLLTVASCSQADPSPSAAPMTLGSVVAHVGPRQPLEGFGEVTVTIVAADGATHTLCLLLADTEALREQGLMFVTDASLGGYDGMLFAYEDDVAGGFWMKNTRLPLSILFASADGSTVSSTDMTPCPDGTEICPSYPAGSPYRYAVEVVQGGLAGIGVSEESRLVVGVKGCGA